MMYSTIVLLTCVVTASDVNHQFSFGYLDEAFSCVQTPLAAQMLDLEREQLLEIGQRNKRFLSSNVNQLIAQRSSALRLSSKDVGALFWEYSEETDTVLEYNQQVLAIVEAMLGKKANSRKYRQLLTIQLLRLGKLASLLRLNEKEIVYG